MALTRWHPTPVLLPGKSHGRRSLVGCSPWGCEESDTTEQLHFHFSLSCMGEGNGNPLQCSCLGNPRHRETWWAAIYGVAQSQTWLKRLSSSSRIFLISVIMLFVSVCLLFNQLNNTGLLIDSCNFSILFSRFLIIFTIIILNSFSGSLPISSSFICTSVFLVCSFLCVVLFCLFIIIHYCYLTYCFWRLLFPVFKVEFFLPFGFCLPKVSPVVCGSFI